jgi:hypothetical protein
LLTLPEELSERDFLFAATRSGLPVAVTTKRMAQAARRAASRLPVSGEGAERAMQVSSERADVENLKRQLRDHEARIQWLEQRMQDAAAEARRQLKRLR